MKKFKWKVFAFTYVCHIANFFIISGILNVALRTFGYPDLVPSGYLISGAFTLNDALHDNTEVFYGL